MLSLFVLIPILVLVSGMFVYRYNGLDMVQFFYAFVLAPVLFIWAKSFIYYLLRTEIDIRLSQLEIFLIDTGFSLIFLYVFAFIVMHSLTKTFNLKSARDPLYDILHHSEYFHLWLTHIVMYVGGMILISIIAFANVFFPLTVQIATPFFYIICTTGFMSGMLAFIGTLLSDPKQSKASFMRLMKLLYGFFFIGHVVVYFVFSPSFTSSYAPYWWSLFFFAGVVTLSFFRYRFAKARTFFDRISDWFKHRSWDLRVDLFDKH
jgi:hypothetical protein